MKTLLSVKCHVFTTIEICLNECSDLSHSLSTIMYHLKATPRLWLFEYKPWQPPRMNRSANRHRVLY